MRKHRAAKDAKWKKLEEDARFNLSNVLGVDSDNVKAYTLYGLVYMEGWQTEQEPPRLSRSCCSTRRRSATRSTPPLQNAYGLYYMHRDALNEALQRFQSAVDGDPKFVEARINVGLLDARLPQVRRREGAVQQGDRARAEELRRVHRPRHRAARPQGPRRRRGAVQEGARQLDPRRGDAYYNLGVLYKDFRANKQRPDPIKASASQTCTGKAKDFFQPVPRQATAIRPTRPRRRRRSRDATRSSSRSTSAITSQMAEPAGPAAPPRLRRRQPPPAGASRPRVAQPRRPLRRRRSN